MKCIKSTCEKYTLRFNKGWDYAIFTIDAAGILQCHSSFGDYAYHWSAFGENFKEFLCRIEPAYLIDKIADKTYLDFEDYQEKAKATTIEERRDGELTKEEARELWDFITNDLDDYSGSYDLVCNEIYHNNILDKLYGGEVFYSNFMPVKDYTPNAKAFAYDIFPKFVEILKHELEEQMKTKVNSYEITVDPDKFSETIKELEKPGITKDFLEECKRTAMMFKKTSQKGE